jgi:hypothetical protein
MGRFLSAIAGGMLLLATAAQAASPFNPLVWYWHTTTGHSGTVFSSAGPGWVATSDSTYLAWVALGNVATPISNDGVLAAQLAQIGTSQPASFNAVVLAVDPTTWTGVSAAAEGLTAYVAGCALTYSGDTSLSATYETTGPAYTYMQDIGHFILAESAFPNSWSTITFQARSGAVTFDTVSHFNGVFDGLINYRAAWGNWVQNGGSAPTWRTCANG